MTSINALRFDEYSGICIGDESISSVAEMRIDVGEKVSPFIPDEIVRQYGTVGVLGTTGTCSVGDSIKENVTNRLRALYQMEVEKAGKKPERFMDMEEIMKLCFDVVIETKHRMLNDRLKGTYGFEVPDFICGRYEKNGKTIEINDNEIVREILDRMVWRNKMEEVGSIFMNAGLMAGYDDEKGFQIFHFDQRDGYWHRVQNCYMAEGSGRHSVDPAIYSFAEKWLISERRGNIDPVEGAIALLHGVNTAADHEIGVGGYYNIILIDGRQKNHRKRLREISDDRSLLANHTVRALEHRFLSYTQAYSTIKALLFEDADFEDMYAQFWQSLRDPEMFSRILRGYKIIPGKAF